MANKSSKRSSNVSTFSQKEQAAMILSMQAEINRLSKLVPTAAPAKPAALATLGHVAGSKPIQRIITPAKPEPVTDSMSGFVAHLDSRFDNRGHFFVERYELLADLPLHQTVYVTIAECAIDSKDRGYAGGAAHREALAPALRGYLPNDVTPYQICQELEAAGFIREVHTGKTSLWFLADIIEDKPNGNRTINRGKSGLADGLKRRA